MPWGYKILRQVAWTTSLCVEALRKKVVRLRSSKKREGKERGWERENWWLLISRVQSLRFSYLLWFLCPGFPESFQWVSLSLEASWSWAPLNFDSDLVLDPSLPNREAPICFSTITCETLHSLLRIGCADHQIQFISILVRSALSVSECVLGVALLILESLQAFTLPVPGQSCHFLDHKPRSTASGRRHPGSRSL